MSAPVNFVARVRAQLRLLGGDPGVSLEDTAAALEDYAAHVLAAKPAPEVAPTLPARGLAPVAKTGPAVKTAAPKKPRTKRAQAAPVAGRPISLMPDKPAVVTWRTFFGFPADAHVTRPQLIAAMAMVPMSAERELMVKIARAEVG